MRKLQRSAELADEGLLRAVLVERPKYLYFNSLCYCQRIFKFNAQVTNCAVHLRMPQQQLNGTQVARFLIDLGDLRASHRMGAIGGHFQTDR